MGFVVYLSRFGNYGAAIVSQWFLFCGVYLSDGSRVVNLSNRVNYYVVVCAIFFGDVIAWMAPWGDDRT